MTNNTAEETDSEKAKADPWQEVESRNLMEPLRRLFTRTNGYAQPSVVWLDVWSATLELDKADTSLYGILNLVSRAVENCVRRIEHTPTFPKQSAKLAISTLKNCGEYLKPIHLHESCNSGKSCFSPEKMNVLVMAGEMLEVRFSEPMLSKEQQDDLLSLVTKMELLLGSGKLDPVLVAAIEPHIKMIRWAIQHYSIVGNAGLMRSCTDAWLEMRRVDEEESNKETEEFKSTLQTFWTHVDRADKIVRIADKGYSVGQKALELFKELPNIVD